MTEHAAELSFDRLVPRVERERDGPDSQEAVIVTLDGTAECLCPLAACQPSVTVECRLGLHLEGLADACGPHETDVRDPEAPVVRNQGCDVLEYHAPELRRQAYVVSD